MIRARMLLASKVLTTTGAVSIRGVGSSTPWPHWATAFQRYPTCPRAPSPVSKRSARCVPRRERGAWRGRHGEDGALERGGAAGPAEGGGGWGAGGGAAQGRGAGVVRGSRAGGCARGGVAGARPPRPPPPTGDGLRRHLAQA